MRLARSDDGAAGGMFILVKTRGDCSSNYLRCEVDPVVSLLEGSLLFRYFRIVSYYFTFSICNEC